MEPNIEKAFAAHHIQQRTAFSVGIGKMHSHRHWADIRLTPRMDLVVSGDLEPVIFRGFLPHDHKHPTPIEGAVSWLGGDSASLHYACERACEGMGSRYDVVRPTAAALRRDLRRLMRNLNADLQVHERDLSYRDFEKKCKAFPSGWESYASFLEAVRDYLDFDVQFPESFGLEVTNRMFYAYGALITSHRLFVLERSGVRRQNLPDAVPPEVRIFSAPTPPQPRSPLFF